MVFPKKYLIVLNWSIPKNYLFVNQNGPNPKSDSSPKTQEVSRANSGMACTNESSKGRSIKPSWWLKRFGPHSTSPVDCVEGKKHPECISSGILLDQSRGEAVEQQTVGGSESRSTHSAGVRKFEAHHQGLVVLARTCFIWGPIKGPGAKHERFRFRPGAVAAIPRSSQQANVSKSPHPTE